MLEKQLEYLRSVTDFTPQIALVLGSGLGSLAEEINAVASVDFSDIPDFPKATAPTHRGRFVFGYVGSAKVAVMQGRIHLYEGYSPQQAVMPVRLLRKTGAEILFLTNASGGINRRLSIGDLMLIEDHISSFVPSPLIGENDNSVGPRFPDMSEVYGKRLKKIIIETALENGIPLKKGTYIQLAGPAFETRAEIKMCSILGADAVGMSTAIEAQTGRQCGFEVCGISCVTNLACGLLDKPITAQEVTETADKTAPLFKKLVIKSIERMANG